MFRQERSKQEGDGLCRKAAYRSPVEVNVF